MEQRTYSETVIVQATPQEVYDLVSDIGRTGEWSPTCVRCEWDEPGHTGVGATFTGHNETTERSWQTTSTVVAAEPGQRWAWEVGAGFVRWSYDLRGVEGGTEVTQTWMFLKAGLQFFADTFGDDAPAAIEDRSTRAISDIPKTLATIQHKLHAA